MERITLRFVNFHLRFIYIQQLRDLDITNGDEVQRFPGSWPWSISHTYRPAVPISFYCVPSYQNIYIYIYVHNIYNVTMTATILLRPWWTKPVLQTCYSKIRNVSRKEIERKCTSGPKLLLVLPENYFEALKMWINNNKIRYLTTAQQILVFRESILGSETRKETSWDDLVKISKFS